MWRLRSMVVLGALVGALIFGAAVAHGSWWWNSWWWNSWWWNAATDGQGVDFRTAWKVVPFGSDTAIQGDQFNYHTNIEIAVPVGANFGLKEKADTETVSLKTDAALQCKANGIEARVSYKVEPLAGAQGDVAKVWVTAGTQLLAQTREPLRVYAPEVDMFIREAITISVPVFILAPSGVTPGCYNGG